MEKEKIYILQKDLPYLRAGAEYRYNDGDYETKDEHLFTQGLKWDRLGRLAVENNPEWFKLKEEVKPTVADWVGSGYQMHFVIMRGNNLPDHEITISKERLAEILIAESKKLIHIDDGYTWFREDSVIKKLEECFNESRLTNPIVGFKYDTFSDYMNDKNKNK